MRVFLLGGTGLIGTEIIRRLRKRGDQAVVLTRDPERARRKQEMADVEFVRGDPQVPGDWQTAINGSDAIVNLVGHSLFAERWRNEVKRKIRDSRVKSTENLASAIARAESRPSVLVQGSAIGYYGDRGDQELTESSAPGRGFMPEVCVAWESAAEPVTGLGVRLAIIRTGIVLAQGEGALGAMTPIFKWVPGGAAPVGGTSNPFLPGTGQQWLSWIHLADIAGLFLMAIDRDEARGPINGTAPHPVRNREFSAELARVLHRPMLPFGPPNLVLRLVLGEVATAVTEGQRVIPKAAMELGYAFQFPELRPALTDVFGKG